MSKGVIYILTNPSFPGWVKIGYADNVEERVKQLNRSECTPFAFRIYATYDVDSRLMDKKVHTIIDKLNRNLRSVDDYNGHRREREFFAIEPEDVYDIFEAMAEIHGCPERLKKWGATAEELLEEEIAEEIQQESEHIRRIKCDNYTFDFWGIPDGAVLTYCDDPEIYCTVVSRRKISYNGEELYMTPFAKIISGKPYLSNGPGWVARHFIYNGKMICEYEK